jgi:hypothetical protein
LTNSSSDRSVSSLAADFTHQLGEVNRCRLALQHQQFFWSVSPTSRGITKRSSATFA